MSCHRRVYTDLNVRFVESRVANLGLLQALAEGGYERVAMCHHVTLTKGVQLKRAPPLSDLLDRIPLTKRGRPLEVLQRLTVTAEDPALLHTLSSPAAESYDVLSVHPTSSQVFQQACGVLSVDIVSVDLSVRSPFPLKNTQLSQAVGRGVHLEICYSSTLRGSSVLKYTLANAQELVKGTKGKNILVCSDAAKPLEVRPPADVINLCHLFGLSDAQCHASVTTSSRAVLMHASMRRDSVKGVVSVTPVHVTTQRKRSAREAERRGLGGETEAERTELGGRTGAERTELGGWEAEEEGTPSPKRLNITTS